MKHDEDPAFADETPVEVERARSPTLEERAQIEAARKHGGPSPAAVSIGRTAKGRRCLAAPHDDLEGHRIVLQRALGTSSPQFVEASLRRLTHLSCPNAGCMPDE